MAKLSNTVAAKQKTIWASGAHKVGIGPTPRMVTTASGLRSTASGLKGWQHAGAYESVIRQMVDEHADGVTHLVIETGNDVVYNQCHLRRPPKLKEHRAYLNVVDALCALFENVQWQDESQRKAAKVKPADPQTA